jgi:ribose transport system substrate-binding protein
MRLVQGVAVASTLAASIFAVAGSSASVAGAASKKMTIAFNVGAEADPFFISMSVGAYAEAAKLGVNLVWEGNPSQYSPSTQLPILEQLYQLKPNAVVIAPTDTKALEGITNQFVKAGIPVVNVDSGNANQKNISAWVTGFNYQGGQAAADTLAKAIDYTNKCTSSAKCAVGVGVSSLSTSTDAARVAGFNYEVTHKFPNMKLLPAVVSQSNSATAQSAFGQEISAQNLTGIFGVDGSDTVGATGAVAAAGSAGANIKVIGYDAYANNVAALQNGQLAGIISQNPQQEGKLAVLYAYDAAKHIKVPHLTQLANPVLTPTTSAADLKLYTYATA